MFLTTKICDKFCADISHIIWSFVENDAASVIINLYFFKVLRNRDIFLQLLNISDFWSINYDNYDTDEEITNVDEDDLHTIHDAYDLIDYIENGQVYQEHGDPWVTENWTTTVSNYDKQRISKYIGYIVNKKLITYSYIQEPGRWLELINNNIRELFFLCSIPSWKPDKTFWVNLRKLTTSIKKGQERYIQTGVMWWE